ncbi:NnrS family protein [Rhizobium sp. A37_96]
MPEAMRCLWQAPHRPLFLATGLWAIVAPSVWLLPREIVPDKIAWHSRELLFGMGGAAVGGYLLTALAAWTKRGPVSSSVTLFVTLLWCLSRLSTAFSRHLPPIVETLGASAYFFALTVILACGIASARDRCRGRAWAPLGTAALGLTAILSRQVTNPVGDTIGPSTVPLMFVMLIVLVGGRATPAFTRAWLDRTDVERPFRDWSALSYPALMAIPAAAGLAAAGRQAVAGLLLILAGLMLFLRMSGWQSLCARRYPALFILHVAFAWTPASLILIGVAHVYPGKVPLGVALHAVTMGAMGTMMLAFMMRAAMIRQGDVLVLNRKMHFAFAFVFLSALLRILAGWIVETEFDPIIAAAVCWIAGWACFLWAYIPALHGPAPRPVFSASPAH